MRFAFTGISLAVLGLAISTAGLAPTNTRRTSLNKLPGRSTAEPAELPRTNAKRLAMGLPPLKPRLFDPLHPAPERRSAIPPLSYTVNCNIHVEDFLRGDNYGYLSPTAIDGRYGPVQSSQTDALEVSFSYSVIDQVITPGQFDLTVTNSLFPSHPYFGAVRSDAGGTCLNSQSSAFVYIGATSCTPAGSPPSVANSEYGDETWKTTEVESAIWTYDPVFGCLIPQWTNPRSSTSPANPTTVVGYVDDWSLLILTGSIDEFNADPANGGATAVEVKLTCVAPPVVLREN